MRGGHVGQVQEQPEREDRLGPRQREAGHVERPVGPDPARDRADELGHVQVRFRDEITTRMPSTDEARRLNIGPGTPVAQLIRTAFDQDDQAVRLAATILPGDRYVLVYDVAGD